MATSHDCSDPSELLSGMRLARTAIARGGLVVLPTDTVYGVAADAFSPAAVQRLLDAKGRGRQSPPPVLIPNLATLEALASEVSDEVRALAEEFWPGGLTIILPARDSLAWDLGDTGGTVALRMPAHPVALELLTETGPLAVSSANTTGDAAATTADEALRMLGDSVEVYLDGGAGGTVGSTIVDATGMVSQGIRVVRHGAIPEERIREVVDGVASTNGGARVAGAQDAAPDAPPEGDDAP